MLRCARCDAAIPPEDVHLGNLLAKCRGCLEVFKFAVPESPGPVLVATGLPQGAMPEGVTIEEKPDARRIVHSWYSSKVWGILLFCVFWDFGVGTFTAALLYGYWTNPDPPDNVAWVFFLVVPGIHNVAGVWITYYCVAIFLNETVVDVTPEFVRVTHGPVPWIGEIELPAADVRQLYGEPHCWGNEDGKRRYRLMAVLADGRLVELVGGLEGKSAAEFYQRVLEEWLELAPAPSPADT